MSEIGVFHANEFNSTFFTRCCEVAICNDQESCPGCGKKVIPAKDRRGGECAHGSKHIATQFRWREKYRASGREQADKVAARSVANRLQGVQHFISGDWEFSPAPQWAKDAKEKDREESR